MGSTDEPNSLMYDNNYFCINEDIFDRIKSTHQEKNVLLKIISIEPNGKDSQYDAAYICVDNIFKKKRNFANNTHCHNILIKGQKNYVDYVNK